MKPSSPHLHPHVLQAERKATHAKLTHRQVNQYRVALPLQLNIQIRAMPWCRDKHKYSYINKLFFSCCVCWHCVQLEGHGREKRKTLPLGMCRRAPGTVSENHFQSRTQLSQSLLAGGTIGITLQMIMDWRKVHLLCAQTPGSRHYPIIVAFLFFFSLFWIKETISWTAGHSSFFFKQ